MKILIVNTLYYPYRIGGAEKSVQLLAESLALKGCTIGVITLDKKDSFECLNKVNIWRLKLDNNYWPFDSTNRTKLDKFLWHFNDRLNKKYDEKILSIFKIFQPQILFTNNLTGFSARIWSLARKKQIKVVHTLRDYSLQCPKSTKFRDNKNCKKNCNECILLSLERKKLSHKIDTVIGISDFILQNHIINNFFKGVERTTIYNGFTFELDKKFNSPVFHDTITFGFIGQINEAKGIEVLLKSFLKLERYSNWKLIIAGTTNNQYLTKLKTINNSANIEFWGYVNSNTFYNNIDVLIVPSLWEEPFGRVVIEGLIHEKIVFGSNRGGIKELLQNNKDFIFEPDEKSLTLILRKFLNSPKSFKNFDYDNSFLKKFHIDHIVSRYKKVFEKVIQ